MFGEVFRFKIKTNQGALKFTANSPIISLSGNPP